MKEKFMNIVGKIKSVDPKVVAKSIPVVVGTVAGLLIGGYLLGQVNKSEPLGEDYYNVIDVEAEDILED